MRHLLIVFFIACSVIGTKATIVLDESCLLAYDQILSLRLEDARKTINEGTSRDPSNPYLAFLDFYCQVVELIITDDIRKYEILTSKFNTALNKLDADEGQSPYYNALRSEMLFHLSLSNMKYGDKLTGARNLIKAHNAIHDNKEDYPDFWLNNKMSGVYDVVFSYLPSSFQWAAKIIGLKGDRNKGLKELKLYATEAASKTGLSSEAILLCSMGYSYGGNESEAYHYLSGIDPERLKNPLVRYYYAIVCLRTQRNDKGMELLGSLNQADYQVKFNGLDYLRGKALLNRLDKDAAVYLQRFYNGTYGNDYKKEIAHKISYNYLINGDYVQYQSWHDKAINYGAELTDRDREAMIDCEQDYTPLPALLRIKYLVEGGYFNRASEELTGISPSQIIKMPENLEYTYWSGRVSQHTGKIQEAMYLFDETIRKGEHQPYYFAADAAFQTGLLFEQANQSQNALTWYQKCLEINDSDYKEFIGRKARSGISRLAKYGSKK